MISLGEKALFRGHTLMKGKNLTSEHLKAPMGCNAVDVLSEEVCESSSESLSRTAEILSFDSALRDTEVPSGKNGLIEAISYALQQSSIRALVNSSPAYASSVGVPSCTSFGLLAQASFRRERVNSRRMEEWFSCPLS